MSTTDETARQALDVFERETGGAVRRMRAALDEALLSGASRFAVLRKYERVIAEDGTVLAESYNGQPLLLVRALRPGETFDHEVVSQIDEPR